jgi:hypothetical protein
MQGAGLDQPPGKLRISIEEKLHPSCRPPCNAIREISRPNDLEQRSLRFGEPGPAADLPLFRGPPPAAVLPEKSGYFRQFPLDDSGL